MMSVTVRVVMVVWHRAVVRIQIAVVNRALLDIFVVRIGHAADNGRHDQQGNDYEFHLKLIINIITLLLYTCKKATIRSSYIRL